MVIYTSLALLALALFGPRLAPLTQEAVADPLWLADTLGPAESVTLSGPGEGDEPLVVRNTGKRLAWGEHASARAYSSAFIHIGAILRPLMDSQTYRDEREVLQEELEETDSELRAEWEAWQEKYGSLQQDDPLVPEAQQAYRDLDMRMRQWQAEHIQRLGELTAGQLERCYREMVDAVNTIADEKNIDIVYRFIPTDEAFEATDPDQAMMAIRLRAVLRYPESIDITSDVLEELSL